MIRKHHRKSNCCFNTLIMFIQILREPKKKIIFGLVYEFIHFGSFYPQRLDVWVKSPTEWSRIKLNRSKRSI